MLFANEGLYEQVDLLLHLLAADRRALILNDDRRAVDAGVNVRPVIFTYVWFHFVYVRAV